MFDIDQMLIFKYQKIKTLSRYSKRLNEKQPIFGGYYKPESFIVPLIFKTFSVKTVFLIVEDER